MNYIYTSNIHKNQNLIGKFCYVGGELGIIEDQTDTAINVLFYDDILGAMMLNREYVQVEIETFNPVAPMSTPALPERYQVERYTNPYILQAKRF